MSGGARARGFLSIAAMLLIVVLALLAIAVGFLVGESSLSSTSHHGAMRAFFLAESGLEAEQRRWAQNLDWYRAASDPDPAAPAPQAFGSGTFTVSTTLPATLLRTRLVVGGATANVYTTSRFPATGILQLGDDITGGAEFVRYGGVTPNSFTGLARGQTVGTVATLAAAHPRSTAVYPVTILRTALAANCLPLASIQVDTHGKFLGAGTVDIEGEELRYGSVTVTGATMTLNGVTRCQGAVINASHAIGQPVTPILVGGDSASQEVEMSASGVEGANVRYARRTVQR